MFWYLGPDPPITLWLPVIPQLGSLSLSGKIHLFSLSPPLFFFFLSLSFSLVLSLFVFFFFSLYVSPLLVLFHCNNHINVWVNTNLAACFSIFEGRGEGGEGGLRRVEALWEGFIAH